MARKVFISFLGTNNYVQTHYQFEDGELSAPVRFIQEALIAKICRDWTEDDRIFIFCTEQSFIANAEDNGQSRAQEEIETIGLKSRLRSMKLTTPVTFPIIPEGFSQMEIWEIFDSVYEKLEEGDEIHFDVTHAFRSIPMFSTILFNFSEVVKDTTVESIHYGAFERLGPAPDVRKMALESRVAPVLDLSSFNDLQHTIQSARDLTQFGKLGRAMAHVEKVSGSTKRQRRFNELLQVIKNQSVSLDYQISTCRMDSLRAGDTVKKLKEAIEGIQAMKDINKSDSILLSKMMDNLQAFKDEPCDENILAAITWALEYGMIQQTYTLGQEFIVSKVTDILKQYNPIHEKDTKEQEKQFREFTSSLLAISDDKVSKNEFTGLLKKYLDTTTFLLEEELVKSIRPYYAKLSDNRNIINHAKTAKGRNFGDLFKENFEPICKLINCQPIPIQC